jgi:hypothetical protein
MKSIRIMSPDDVRIMDVSLERNIFLHKTIASYTVILCCTQNAEQPTHETIRFCEEHVGHTTSPDSATLWLHLPLKTQLFTTGPLQNFLTGPWDTLENTTFRIFIFELCPWTNSAGHGHTPPKEPKTSVMMPCVLHSMHVYWLSLTRSVRTSCLQNANCQFASQAMFH